MAKKRSVTDLTINIDKRATAVSAGCVFCEADNILFGLENRQVSSLIGRFASNPPASNRATQEYCNELRDFLIRG